MRANAARYLAYAESKGAAEALRPLVQDSDPQVRQAAAVGLTFLGQADYLESLRSIVNQTTVKNEDAPRSSLGASHDEDPLIALAHQHSDAAVDILGARLLSDLKGLTARADGHATVRLEGRPDRATQICKLLGRTGNTRSVVWLTSADDLISSRPDLARYFPLDNLAHSMLCFVDQTKDRICDELETGNAAATWAYSVSRTHNPHFFPAIHTMLRRQDVTDNARRCRRGIPLEPWLAASDRCAARGV